MKSIAPTTPVGVRDYSPEAADAFYALQETLVGTFTRAGYRRVMTPAFELASVFERGLGPSEAERLMRFVDPQNGEMLCLRSDMTPQIARLVAGSLRDAPLPLRLSYFGRVFRLRQHSEFRSREVAQAGVELIGMGGADADVEVLTLCDEALHAASPGPHTLSIGHVGFISAALDALPASEHGPITALLRRKDSATISQRLASLDLPAAQSELVQALPTLYGSADVVLPKAQALSTRLPALQAPLQRLTDVIGALTDAGTRSAILVDLGEVLGFGYYSGIVFHAYTHSVGQSVASGGRYDGLLARYGRDLPAAGFAIDEEGLTRHQAK
ncbi:MAG: ATP phosphoribosyltransferase regulatory subunit [Myxococcota bacterium]|jgi:ATP phosphoribosyltransferase regulatory subunit